jgi:hypothetical protein
MGLDIRVPIGVMFSIIGVLLTLHGLVAGHTSVGVNINLWWGLVLLVFAIPMLVFGLRPSNETRAKPR